MTTLRSDSCADTAAALLDQYDHDGYVVVERAAPPEVVTAVADELRPWLGDGAHRGRNDFEGFSTNRVYGLLAKAPSVARLVEHPVVLALLDEVLSPNYLLSANLAINLLPGETAQSLHFDDSFYPLPRPRPALGVSAIWAIDDFTAANGATEVLPGSHRWAAEKPSDDDPALFPSRCRPDRWSSSPGRCGTVAAPIGRTGRAWPSPPSTARRGCASRNPR